MAVRLAITICLLGALATAAPALAEEAMGRPPVQEQPLERRLIALAPTLSSDDAEVRQIRIEGRLRLSEHGALTFRALYDGPDQHGLWVSAAEDGTPLLASAGGEAFLYDAARQRLLWRTGCSPFLRASWDGESLTLDFGFQSSGETDEPDLLLDVASFFRDVRDPSARPDGVGYVLTAFSERGNRVVARVDPERACPFHSIRFYAAESEEPMLAFELVAVNEEPAGAPLSLPARERMAELVTVESLADDDLQDGFAVMRWTMRSFLSRLAIHEPALREDIESLFGEPIDWKALEKADRAIAPALRDALPD